MSSLQHPKKTGESLIELVLSTAIFAAVLPAILYAMGTVNKSEPQKNNLLNAAIVVEESKNILREVKNTNWNSLNPNGTYVLNQSGGVWSLVTPAAGPLPTVRDSMTRTITTQDVRRDASGQVVASGGTVDAASKRADINVTWTGATSPVTAQIYLTRHESLATLTYTEVGDFDTGGQIHNGTQTIITPSPGTDGSVTINNLEPAKPATPVSWWQMDGVVGPQWVADAGSGVNYAIVSTPIPTITPCPGNLITNPGFESNMSNWNDITITNTYTVTDPYLGTNSSRIGAGAGTYGQNVPVTPGQTLRLTVYAKIAASPTTATVGVTYLNSSLVQVGSPTTQAISAATYTQSTITSTVPAGAAYAQVWASTTGGTGTLTADEYCLVDTSRPTAYFTDARYGKALLMTGGVYLLINSSPSLSTLSSGSGFSYEAFIKPVGTTLRPMLDWVNIPTTPTPTPGAQTAIQYSTTHDIITNLIDTSGASHSVTLTNQISSNTYQHVAMVYDRVGGVVRHYKNGIQIGSTSVGSFTAQTSFPLYVGYRPYASIFTGEIDDLALYNTPLTDQQVFDAAHAIYTSPIRNLSSSRQVYRLIADVAQPTNTKVRLRVAMRAATAGVCSSNITDYTFIGPLGTQSSSDYYEVSGTGNLSITGSVMSTTGGFINPAQCIVFRAYFFSANPYVSGSSSNPQLKSVKFIYAQ